MSKPILCVDFDGVLHSYTSGWQGADVVADGPVVGATLFLTEAINHFDVHIYSSRSSNIEGRKAMRRAILAWLTTDAGKSVAQGVVRQLTFSARKPAAFLTIDDRAITFNGTFPRPETLTTFRPWNKRVTA